MFVFGPLWFVLIVWFFLAALNNNNNGSNERVILSPLIGPPLFNRRFWEYCGGIILIAVAALLLYVAYF